LATTGNEKPALQRKLSVSGAMAYVSGFAHATPAPNVYLPLAHAAHRLPLASWPALQTHAEPSAVFSELLGHVTPAEKHSEAACALTSDVWPVGQVWQLLCSYVLYAKSSPTSATERALL